MLDPDSQNFLSVCFGYGFALMIGILVSGNVSGGHLNPAVTLALAVVKKCSWLQVRDPCLAIKLQGVQQLVCQL